MQPWLDTLLADPPSGCCCSVAPVRLLVRFCDAPDTEQYAGD
nr:hypothetical protein [Rhodococcus wratislaviensis]